MALARERVAAGEKPGFVVSADFQSSGRGRVPGRSWESRRGENLLFTLVLPRESVAKVLTPLPVMAGLGVSLVLERAAGISTLLKWPNDLLAGGRKISGILCETYGAVAAVGVGLNVLQTDFDHAGGAGEGKPEATSLLLETGRAFDPKELLRPVVEGVLEAVREPGWREMVAERLYRGGETVAVNIGDPEKGSVVNGRIAGIGESGELLLDTGGKELLRLFSAELSYYTATGEKPWKNRQEKTPGGF